MAALRSPVTSRSALLRAGLSTLGGLLVMVVTTVALGDAQIAVGVGVGVFLLLEHLFLSEVSPRARVSSSLLGLLVGAIAVVTFGTLLMAPLVALAAVAANASGSLLVVLLMLTVLALTFALGYALGALWYRRRHAAPVGGVVDVPIGS